MFSKCKYSQFSQLTESTLHRHWPLYVDIVPSLLLFFSCAECPVLPGSARINWDNFSRCPLAPRRIKTMSDGPWPNWPECPFVWALSFENGHSGGDNNQVKITRRCTIRLVAHRTVCSPCPRHGAPHRALFNHHCGLPALELRMPPWKKWATVQCTRTRQT